MSTFATRLTRTGRTLLVISALLGHATPMTGLGNASPTTPGYFHATWDAMVDAVAKIELYRPSNSASHGLGTPKAIRKASWLGQMARNPQIVLNISNLPNCVVNDEGKTKYRST